MYKFYTHTHTSYFCFPGELKLIQCALGMRIGTETEKIRAKFSTPGNQGKVLETNLRLDQWARSQHQKSRRPQRQGRDRVDSPASIALYCDSSTPILFWAPALSHSQVMWFEWLNVQLGHGYSKRQSWDSFWNYHENVKVLALGC